MKDKSKSIIKTIPAIVFGIIIFILSSFEYKLPSGPPGTYRAILLLLILHIGEFGLFSMLLMYGFYPKIKIYFLILISILYGVLDEIHQGFVPTRYFDILDIICDSIGTILGVVGFFILIKIIKILRKNV